jgi:hypothetical protein
MRFLIPLLIISLLAVSVVAKVAELWSITLTTDQISKVNAAGDKGTTITLTTAQIDQIKLSFPSIKTNTLLVKPSQIVSNNKLNGVVSTAGIPSAKNP